MNIKDTKLGTRLGMGFAAMRATIDLLGAVSILRIGVVGDEVDSNV